MPVLMRPPQDYMSYPPPMGPIRMPSLFPIHTG